MSAEYAFRGTRRSIAHAYAIHDEAPNSFSACHLVVEHGYGTVDPEARQCRRCVQEIARRGGVVVEWLTEWDRYLRALQRAEQEAREEVREVFYGPRRRRTAPAASPEEPDEVTSRIDASLEWVELSHARWELQRGELPEDADRRRAAERSPERLAALRAENEAMAADLRRKRLVAVD